MERIAFFDAKPYDRIYFDKLNRDFELVYFESRLRPESVKLAEGCRAVCAFVNDDIGASTVRSLADIGVEMIAMRCAGREGPRIVAICGRGTRDGHDTHAQPEAPQSVHSHTRLQFQP